MIPGVVTNTQGRVVGWTSQNPGFGSFTIKADSFTVTNSLGQAIFTFGKTGPSPREIMEEKRSKDQAAPWWKRIVG